MTRRPARWAFGLHAVMVAALLALFAVAVVSADPGEGANIGAGLVLLPLLGLGLPWSLPFLLARDVLATGVVAIYFLALGPAVVNVGIHALVLWLRRRRRGADPSRRGGSK